MGYRWNDFVSNQRLLRETESRPITSIVHQRQLRLYGHVARYPEQLGLPISERDNPEWRRPRGAPKKFVAGANRCFLLGATWNRKGDLYGMIARAGVGGLAKRRISWQ